MKTCAIWFGNPAKDCVVGKRLKEKKASPWLSVSLAPTLPETLTRNLTSLSSYNGISTHTYIFDVHPSCHLDGLLGTDYQVTGILLSKKDPRGLTKRHL